MTFGTIVPYAALVVSAVVPYAALVVSAVALVLSLQNYRYSYRKEAISNAIKILGDWEANTVIARRELAQALGLVDWNLINVGRPRPTAQQMKKVLVEQQELAKMIKAALRREHDMAKNTPKPAA